jgi:hypothetical protein
MFKKQKKNYITVKRGFYFFLLKEVRNATKAHIALIRDSPYVPRALQMHLG